MKKSFIPIEQFRKDELDHLVKQFAEEKIGNLVIETPPKKNEEFVFWATIKGTPACDFFVESRSTDAHHAKDKLIKKLRMRLREEKNKDFTKPVDFAREEQKSEKELRSVAA